MTKSPAFAGLFRQSETPAEKAGVFLCALSNRFPDIR